MITMKGTSVFSGVAIGPLRFLSKATQSISRKHIQDTAGEIARFHQARERAGAELDGLYEKALAEVGEANAAIFEIHKMMLDDLDYCESVTNIIHSQNVNAEYAISVTADNFAEIFTAMDDAYMQGRAADVRDVSERLQKILAPDKYGAFHLTKPSIVTAQDLAPSETVSLDRSLILALATAEGSVNSHTSILARSMAIPAAIGMGENLNASLDGKEAIMDGFTGTLYIEPDEVTMAEMRAKKEEADRHTRLLETLKGKPNITKSGKQIKVYANAGSISGVGAVLNSDAGGIGLFRSEFLYLERNEYPSEQDQFLVYKQVAQSMGGRTVIIRTLDIGADKQADYFQIPHEENPAMGFRAIRICLERPELFKTQLRALLRASAFGAIAIMFPMIISVRELEDIFVILEEVKQELRTQGISFNEDIETGIMIETPAAVMMADELAVMADFFSIGTNDLTQYTLAIDRQNHSLSRFYEPRHPALLKMIKMTIDAAHKAGKWCGICGELGADLALTEEFIRMGLDELSVSPGMVLPLREKIRSLP